MNYNSLLFFKSLISKFRKSNLVRVSFFSGISTVVKMFTAFLTAKIVSVYLGPEGLGIIGQLNSFMIVVLGFATGSINNGIVKYVSEYSSQKDKQYEVIHASISITLLFSLIVSFVLIFFSNYWSTYVFGSRTDYSSVIVVFGLSIIFTSLYNLSISIINGFQEYKKLNVVSISASLLGLLFTLILIYLSELKGALYAMVTYQSICFFIAFGLIKKNIYFKFNTLFDFKQKKAYMNLLTFSLMSLTTTLASPLVQLNIRSFLTQVQGPIITGFYEGVNRISMLYLTLITNTLSVYYLPKLSSLKDRNDIKSEIINGYKVILPLLFGVSFLIYILRTPLIKIAFTSEFLPMESFFLPQLIGDFFKIASWLLAFLMLAKSMVKTFIITEVLFGVMLVILTRYFVAIMGGEGVVWAYCINYALYFITMYFVINSYLKKSE